MRTYLPKTWVIVKYNDHQKIFETSNKAKIELENYKNMERVRAVSDLYWEG